VVGWGFYLFGLNAFLEAAYSGESWSYFNDYAARWRGRQTHPTLDLFLREARALLFRFGVLATVVVGVTIGTWWMQPTLLTSFFSEATSPFNLALFRIAVFGILLAFDLGEAQWYAQLPSSLQFPPTGISPILSVLSTDPTVVSVMTVVFRIACVFGLFGLFTPVSAAVALVSGLYVLGIPQFYGKINHYHHVLWFTALLVPSRCADVLSLDALRRAGGSSGVRSPEPDRAYALPLRYAWILLGLVYFFPGVWKFAGEGVAWAFSDNLKYRMHSVWFSRSFTPVFRIDRYPLLYQGAGAFTLLFEIGFLFTLPFRSLRPWAAGVAFLFHESTRLFLAITFWTLYPILPFLIDLRALCRRLGRRLGAPLTLVYDGAAAWERRVAESVLRMDLFGRLRVRARESERPDDPVLLLSDQESGAQALWTNGRLRWGAVFRLLMAVPAAGLLLPLAPFARTASGATPGADPRGRATLAVTVVGGVLIAANVICGLAKINSYPFSVYPTFAVRADSTVTTLRVEGIGPSGRSVDVLAGSQDHEEAGFSAARFRGLVRSILRMNDDQKRTKKLRALWSVVRDRRPELGSITEVRFYEATYRSTPTPSADRLLSTTLLTALEVSATGRLETESGRRGGG
jgi:hypothetical protein